MPLNIAAMLVTAFSVFFLRQHTPATIRCWAHGASSRSCEKSRPLASAITNSASTLTAILATEPKDECSYFSSRTSNCTRERSQPTTSASSCTRRCWRTVERTRYRRARSSITSTSNGTGVGWGVIRSASTLSRATSWSSRPKTEQEPDRWTRGRGDFDLRASHVFAALTRRATAQVNARANAKSWPKLSVKR